jgi:electron transport complex protein RnfC
MIRLPEHKHSTERAALKRAPLPQKAYIPLSQHIGKLCEALVKAGDCVRVGQKIGGLRTESVYAPVHASVSGTVVAVQDAPHPVLGTCPAVVIESDGRDEHEEFCVRSSEQVKRLSPDQIRALVFEAGVIGMGGAAFPAHVKLNPPRPVQTLIVNGAECEPYLTCDFRLMMERPKEIMLGAAVAAQCLGVEKVVIAIEDNKAEAIRRFREAVVGTPYKVAVLKSAYPQGGEKQIIKTVLGTEVPRGKLPFEVGVVVQNVATVQAIYEAVFTGKPLYERAVTVTGNCCAQPGNFLVRVGTPIQDLIALCGPLTHEPEKILIGGPMMGIAQHTSLVPVTKATSGVVLLSGREAHRQEEEMCIRCGACLRACPMNLQPCSINMASIREQWSVAKAYSAADCIECGVCNYSCPARRTITQSVKRAKMELNK